MSDFSRSDSSSRRAAEPDRPRSRVLALALVLTGVLIGIILYQRELLGWLDRESIREKVRDVRGAVQPRVRRPGERIANAVGTAISESADDVRSTRPDS